MHPTSDVNPDAISHAPRGIESPELFRHIVQTVADAIISIDERQRVVLFNEQAQITFGYPADEVLGKPLELLLPESFREAHQAHVAAFGGQGITRRRMGEASYLLGRKKNGDNFPIEVTISKLECDGQKLLTAVVRDYRKGKEDQIQRLNEELERRVRERTRELAASQERLADAQEMAGLGHFEYHVSSDRLFWSRNLYRIFGLSTEQFEGTREAMHKYVHPDDRAVFRSAIRRALDGDGRYDIEFRIARPDGSERILHGRAKLRPDQPPTEPLFFGTVQDITERRLAEKEIARRDEMLERAQKMEAIGALAGGVAHDFNNLLTIIQGRTENLQGRLGSQDPGRRDTQVILQATERAAKLTEELLAFGRKQVRQPGRLDLRELLRRVSYLLGRIAGTNAQIAIEAAPDVRPIWADEGQIEQVLYNLVVNASEALPAGGHITIETSNITIAGDLAQRLAAEPGGYVKLAVRDDGAGMNAEQQAHIFEPFYSKPIGASSSLALSAVYGIVTQSGGCIEVDSSPGQGSCFTIYFPVVAGEETAQALPFGSAAPADATHRAKTILVAEDEDDVREIVTDFLRSQGYTVLAGADGTAALRAALDHPGPIDLLLTDIMMPSMDGPTLADTMTFERPDLKVLFITGYAPESRLLQGRLQQNASLLRKPLSLTTLGRMVREQVGNAIFQ